MGFNGRNRTNFTTFTLQSILAWFLTLLRSKMAITILYFINGRTLRTKCTILRDRMIIISILSTLRVKSIWRNLKKLFKLRTYLRSSSPKDKISYGSWYRQKRMLIIRFTFLVLKKWHWISMKDMLKMGLRLFFTTGIKIAIRFGSFERISFSLIFRSWANKNINKNCLNCCITSWKRLIASINV